MKEADFEAEIFFSFPTLLLCVMAVFPQEMGQNQQSPLKNLIEVNKATVMSDLSSTSKHHCVGHRGLLCKPHVSTFRHKRQPKSLIPR